MKRILGRTGIEASAIGMGCWAIGGPWIFLGSQAGWSTVDDAESIRAIHAALDEGVTLFDTAANYGCGHSELLLGRALAGRRDQVVIATKFGYDIDEKAKTGNSYGPVETESDAAPHVRENLEDSLRRLGTDYVDLYQLHIWGLTIEKALPVRDELEKLVADGKIRTYGWSTDRADALEAFSTLPGCGAMQIQLNLMDDKPELLAIADRLNLGVLNRAPLGMGMLTGKITPARTFAEDDVRKHAQWFAGIQDGKPNQAWLDALESIREILTSGGRTLAQGALGWIWARSERTFPIPGFRNVAQARENAAAMRFGPLTAAQMADIDRILAR